MKPLNTPPSSSRDPKHDSAWIQIKGEAEFIDDRPSLPNEVCVGIVLSTQAHARIKAIDFDQVLKNSDVVGVFTFQDFVQPYWGTIFQDQPILANGTVNYVGEAVALIACKTRSLLQSHLKKVKVHYEPLPAILSINQAKLAKSFIGTEKKIERGDINNAFIQAEHELAGVIKIEGAEHFYLENQVAVVYPVDGGQLEVHSSTQHPTETQHVIAHCLGLSDSQVTVKVRRMGGAFGGKESQAAPIAAYAALVAYQLNCPARIILTKDEDMVLTGKRNPFENQYRVAFTSTGMLTALEVNLFSDGGAYADLSTSILERAMLHCDNAYFIPHVRITGQVCRTHYHPHTAFRGFGGPKGVATIEYIIERVAHHLKMDALDVRKKNLYRGSGLESITPYGQKVENNCLAALFDQLEKKTDYRNRRKAIIENNLKPSQSLTPLIGLSLTAVKFGISFTTRFLNQGNALVHIHRDGTLQVSTGATEMGQGVNSRIAELLALELSLPRSHVRMMPTSTEKNANTSPTAASSGTDINGAAALLALRKIKFRLSEFTSRLLLLPRERWPSKTAGLGTEPEITVNPYGFLETDPNAWANWGTGVAEFFGVKFDNGVVSIVGKPELGTLLFSELINEAYLSRVSLSDYAHYRIPGIEFNKLTGQGRAFLYFTQGVACSEVAVDRFTGEVKVKRVDILMDLGRSILEGLDQGQVSGAFIQGMGWMTTEKLFYNNQGALLAHAPSTYKIPNIQDTPRVFNIELLENLGNTVNVRGTKAVGEPPLLLAVSVWTAIQDALKGLPQYAGHYPTLSIPATQEVVLRALYETQTTL